MLNALLNLLKKVFRRKPAPLRILRIVFPDGNVEAHGGFDPRCPFILVYKRVNYSKAEYPWFLVGKYLFAQDVLKLAKKLRGSKPNYIIGRGTAIPVGSNGVYEAVVQPADNYSAQHWGVK